jgi:Tfp pilus assembly protein PilF
MSHAHAKRKGVVGGKPAPAPAAVKHFPFNLLIVPLLLILGWTVYSNTFQAPFHFDDLQHVMSNPAIRDVTNLKANWEYNRARFIPYLTLALNYRFGRLDVTGYHVFNLLLHILTSLLVYKLTVLTFQTPKMRASVLAPSARGVACFAALIFLCHPLQSQAVTYIVQRMAGLVTFFYLGALVAYIRARLSGRRVYFALAVFCGLCALVSKENAYTLPIAVLLYEHLFIGEIRPTRRNMAIFGLIAIGVTIIFVLNYGQKMFAPGNLQNVFRASAAMNPQNYFMTQWNVLRTYLRLLVLPVNQNLDYDYPVAKTIFQPETFLSGLFLAALLIAAYRMRRRHPLASFCIFWFFLTLFIESSFFPIADVIFEHRLYLAMPGFSIAVACLAFFLLKKPHWILAFALCYLMLLGVATYRRNRVWRSEEALWLDVIEKSPKKVRGYNNLALYYNENKKYEEALKYAQIAMLMGPRYAELTQEMWSQMHCNLGVAYYGAGDIGQAFSLILKSIEISKDDSLKYYRLGQVYEKKNDLRAALKTYKKGLEINPDDDRILNALGIHLARRGSPKAAALFKRAIRANPDSAEAYHNLGLLEKRDKDYPHAIDHISTAILIDPKEPQYAASLGVARLESGDALGAVTALEKAVSMMPGVPKSHYYLACAYLQAGAPSKAAQEAAILKQLRAFDLADAVMEFLKNHSEKSRS